MILNYKYGLKAPITLTAEVNAQLHAGHRYRNTLMEIKRRHHPPLANETPEAKTARMLAWNADVRAARATCGAYWGTYLLAEAAMDGANNFRRWTGDAAIGVQTQGGMSVDDLTTDSRVQLVELVHKGVTMPLGPKWKMLRLRIGSVGREPVWAEWPIKMHRPLPSDAVIKWVKVRREVRGDAKHWTVVFVIATELRDAPAQGLRAARVGVDLGWRRLDGGAVRVAYWYGSDGREGELRLDSGLLERIEAFASARDRHLNEHRATLVEWLTGIGLQHVALWQSADRFAHALFDREPPDVLRAWRKQDRHLANACAGMRRQLANQRLDTFRVFAARLAREYAEVRVEDCNLADLRRKRDNDTPSAKPSRRLSAMASPGELRQVIAAAAQKFCAELVKVPAANTTRTCVECATVNNWTDQTPMMLTCSGCGATWDQDRNAARIIASASVIPRGGCRKITGMSARQRKLRGLAREDTETTGKIANEIP